jgi:hypothetical protein
VKNTQRFHFNVVYFHTFAIIVSDVTMIVTTGATTAVITKVESSLDEFT